jgi:hypothetical protein
MKVRMKSTYASGTQRCYAGGVVEVLEAEGRDLIKGGYGEEVVEESATEEPAKKPSKPAAPAPAEVAPAVAPVPPVPPVPPQAPPAAKPAAQRGKK